MVAEVQATNSNPVSETPSSVVLDERIPDLYQQAVLAPAIEPRDASWNGKVVLKRVLAALAVLGLIAAAYFTFGTALIAIPLVKYCLVAWLGVAAIGGAYHAVYSKEINRDKGHNVEDFGSFLLDTAFAPAMLVYHVGENLIGCWVK